jgi:hypothetical protein
MRDWLGFFNREDQLPHWKKAKVDRFPSFSNDLPILRQRPDSNSTSVISNPLGVASQFSLKGSVPTHKNLRDVTGS